MKKQTIFIYILCIIAIAIFSRVFFWEGMEGPDFSFHYTIVDQALKGTTSIFDSRNAMAYCGEGVIPGHPFGYYLIPYLFAKAIGIDAAFYILPILFGIISVLISYFFLARIYSPRVGLLTAFFLSISLAHITKTFPNVYRGETITYPFLLLALYFAYLFLTEEQHRLRNAILGGIMSAVPFLLWNGYILEIFVYIMAIGAVVVFRFFKNADLMRDAKCLLASFLVQFLALFFFYLFIPIMGKGRDFLLYYYPFILFCIVVGYATLVWSQKVRSLYPLAILTVVAGAIGYLARSRLSILLEGFGSITSSSNLAAELTPVTPPAMIFFFGGLYLMWLAALIWMIIKIDHRAAFILGWFLPIYYTMTRASRFLYLASIPMVAMASAFLSNSKIVKKKFDIFVFLTVIFLIIQPVILFAVAPTYFAPQNEEFMKTLKFIKEHTSEDACIVAIKNKGSTIERVAQRNNYFNTLGLDDEREVGLYTLLLYGKELNVTYENLYLLLVDSDLRVIRDLAAVSGIPNPDVSYELKMANPFLFYSPEVYTAFETDNTTVYQIFNKEYQPFRYSYFIEENLTYNPGGRGCFYSNGYHNLFFYLGDNLCDTVLYKALTGQEILGMEKIYFKDGYAVYKYMNYTSPSSRKESRALFSTLPRGPI